MKDSWVRDRREVTGVVGAGPYRGDVVTVWPDPVDPAAWHIGVVGPDHEPWDLVAEDVPQLVAWLEDPSWRVTVVPLAPATTPGAGPRSRRRSEGGSVGASRTSGSPSGLAVVPVPELSGDDAPGSRPLLHDADGALLGHDADPVAGTAHIALEHRGRPWVLGLPPGTTDGPVQVHPGPSPDHVVVVNRGAAHLVSATAVGVPAVSLLMDDAAEVVLARDDGVLLVIGDVDVACVDTIGRRWLARGVALGGLRHAVVAHDVVVLTGRTSYDGSGEVALSLVDGSALPPSTPPLPRTRWWRPRGRGRWPQAACVTRAEHRR